MRASPARRMQAGVLYVVRSTTAALTMASSDAASRAGKYSSSTRRSWLWKQQRRGTRRRQEVLTRYGIDTHDAAWTPNIWSQGFSPSPRGKSGRTSWPAARKRHARRPSSARRPCSCSQRPGQKNSAPRPRSWPRKWNATRCLRSRVGWLFQSGGDADCSKLLTHGTVRARGVPLTARK